MNDVPNTALKFVSTNDASGGNMYLYQTISTSGYTFQTGDYIEYDTKLLSNANSIGGIDICCGSSYFRDIPGWKDQNEITGNPNNQLSGPAYNFWYHRKLAVPSSMIGKTATEWLVVNESDVLNTSFTALYDNFVVTRTGAVVKTVFSNASDCPSPYVKLRSSSGITSTISFTTEALP
jgi:hypothetical protein